MPGTPWADLPKTSHLDSRPSPDFIQKLTVAREFGMRLDGKQPQVYLVEA